MADTAKKRQQSSVDRLPPDIRGRLEALLRDRAFTQLDAMAEVNELLEAQGLPFRLTKSSVNRYAQRMEAVGTKIRQGREIAKMWVAELGNEPQGEVGRLLNEVVRNLAFETATRLAEGEAAAEPKALRELGQAIKALEEASTINERREAEIRKKALEEAAKSLEKTAVQEGVSAETIAKIRRDVLGMAA